MRKLRIIVACILVAVMVGMIFGVEQVGTFLLKGIGKWKENTFRSDLWLPVIFLIFSLFVAPFSIHEMKKLAFKSFKLFLVSGSICAIMYLIGSYSSFFFFFAFLSGWIVFIGLIPLLSICICWLLPHTTAKFLVIFMTLDVEHNEPQTTRYGQWWLEKF